MALTDMLCKSLQNKSLDILNAVNCVKTTVGLLSTLRENGWDSHIEHVESVCRENDIDMPEMVLHSKEVVLLREKTTSHSNIITTLMYSIQ